MSAATNSQLAPGFKRRRRPAFSLIELLIVVALMTILAGVVLPQFEPSTINHLNNAAKIVASDISYARNLAVTNGSSYRLTFNLAENRYTLEHVGTNPLLNNLPLFTFDSAADNLQQQVTDFDDLPQVNSVVSVVGLHEFTANEYDFNWGSFTSQLEPLDSIQFGPLGELTVGQSTIIWLAAGSGDKRFFIPIRVQPITGITSIGKPMSYESVASLFDNRSDDSGNAGTGDAGASDPAASDPAASDPAASDPAASDPAASDPAASDPAASDPAASDPAASDPAASDPAASDPAASDPAASDPAASDPAASDPAASDPAASDPAASDPAASDPAASDPAASDPGAAAAEPTDTAA